MLGDSFVIGVEGSEYDDGYIYNNELSHIEFSFVAHDNKSISKHIELNSSCLNKIKNDCHWFVFFV